MTGWMNLELICGLVIHEYAVNAECTHTADMLLIGAQ